MFRATNKNKQKKVKRDWSWLSNGLDALWDTFSQVARAIGSLYLLYQWFFVSVEHYRDAWMLAVGGALIIDFALEIYRINHDARSN